MVRTGRGPLALALIALSAGCGRCGRAQVAPERHLPAGSAAIVAPRVGAAADDAAALLAALARFPAAAGLADRRSTVAAQLGFDPLDRQGLAAMGLDPDGGAALARSDGGWLLALPVADAGRLGDVLARVAQDRLGAGVRDVERRDSASVVVARAAAGGPAVLVWAFEGRLALVAAGAGGPALIARAARLAEPDSLAASASWRAARKALPERAALVAFAPPAGWPISEIAPLRDGAALGLSVDADRLELSAAALLAPDRAETWRAVAGASEPPVEPRLSALPAGAIFAARFGGDTQAAGRRLLGALPASSREALARAGLDVEQDLLAALAPGAALSISLAPTFDFTAFSRGDPRRRAQEPFRFGHLAAVLRLRDEAAGLHALDALAAAAPRLGLEPRREGGLLLLGSQGGGDPLRLAVRGDRLLVAGGTGQFEEVERIRAGSPGFEPPAAVRGGPTRVLGEAVLHPEHLVAAVHALPDEAFGSGPDRFVMRSIADRLLDPAARLAGAALRVELLSDPAAARATLSVVARRPADGAVR